MKTRMLKYTLTILFSLISFIAFSQTTYTSLNNHTGYWSDVNTWDQYGIPSKNNSNIIIKGYVTRQTDLTIGQGNTLTVNSGDTLVFNGNLTINQDGNLIVEPNAVLIILGNFEAKNSVDVFSNSTIIINGTYTAKAGATFNHEPGSELYILGKDDFNKSAICYDVNNNVIDCSSDLNFSSTPPGGDIGDFFCSVKSIATYSTTIDCNSIPNTINECAPLTTLSFYMPSLSGNTTCGSGEIFWTFENQSGKAQAGSPTPIDISTNNLPKGTYYLQFQFGNSYCTVEVIVSDPPTTGTITK